MTLVRLSKQLKDFDLVQGLVKEIFGILDDLQADFLMVLLTILIYLTRVEINASVCGGERCTPQFILHQVLPSKNRARGEDQVLSRLKSCLVGLVYYGEMEQFQVAGASPSRRVRCGEMGIDNHLGGHGVNARLPHCIKEVLVLVGRDLFRHIRVHREIFRFLVFVILIVLLLFRLVYVSVVITGTTEHLLPRSCRFFLLLPHLFLLLQQPLRLLKVALKPSILPLIVKGRGAPTLRNHFLGRFPRGAPALRLSVLLAPLALFTLSLAPFSHQVPLGRNLEPVDHAFELRLYRPQF
mmetsp:Transcript_26253/g.53810  ORF Transcript_26253/g.53810 Transcript_26253/m.53810 type:complete len:296 (-) Transcript_26253:33-920(-)